MRNEATGSVVVERAAEAISIAERLLGLLGRCELPRNEALWLRANGIHTFGMRFAIDVLILDSEGRVLRVAPAVPPNRIVLPVRAGRVTIEMASGAAADHGIEAGHRLLRSDR